MTESGATHVWDSKPEDFDDAWWESVLQEDEQHAPTGHDRREHFTGGRGNELGRPEDWTWAHDLYECDECVELPVVGHNRGGLLVEARSLRGFVPVSHIVNLKRSEFDPDRGEGLAAFVGDTLQLKVIEFDPERGRLVFSERAAKAGPGKRIELLSNLARGDRVTGSVTNITRFGVFVDLGGVEGLIHVSELSWGRVRHPSDVVSVGQEVEVQVLAVDSEQGRVGLSLKELLPDPWADVDKRYNVGDIIEGYVTNVVKFGAFVGIEEGLEGLIHVSELGDGQFLHPRSVIEEGERVRARIIHIDPYERRLGLSLREVSQNGGAEAPSEEDEGAHEALPSM